MLHVRLGCWLTIFDNSSQLSMQLLLNYIVPSVIMAKFVVMDARKLAVLPIFSLKEKVSSNGTLKLNKLQKTQHHYEIFF